MCKIFAMTDMSNVDLSPEFLESVRDAVCKHGDRDGFGYAAVSDDGALFGERTIKPMAFRPLADPVASKRVRSLPVARTTSDEFGERPAGPVKALIAHGRMSTNSVNLPNTHPFVSPGIALIHNGVVSDASGSVKGSLKTNCDSEILLRLWEKAGMDGIEAHSAGYYAIAVLDSQGLLHVARDDRASLHIAWSDTVESFLIATTPEIIADIADDMDWDIGAIEPIKDNTYAVFNGNAMALYRSISPLGYARGISNSDALRALGSDIPAYRDDAPTEFRDGYALDDDGLDWRADLELADDDAPAYRITARAED